MRVAEPMLPFALFRERNFAAANAQTFLVYAGLYGFFVFFTLYLQFLGFTPFEAGLLNIPSSIVMIVLAARFGALADKHGPRLFLTRGPGADRARDARLRRRGHAAPSSGPTASSGSCSSPSASR